MVGVMLTRETNERSSVLTLKQAAEYLRISKAHLSNILRGKVPGVPPLRCARVGRRVLIKLAWADEWLTELGERSRQANGNI
jgi:excisionase family DNA binding protein